MIKTAHTDLVNAQRELLALRRRLRMTSLILLDADMAAAQRFLIGCQAPCSASLELQAVGKKLSAYPSLRRSIASFAERLQAFVTNESLIQR